MIALKIIKEDNVKAHKIKILLDKKLIIKMELKFKRPIKLIKDKS